MTLLSIEYRSRIDTRCKGLAPLWSGTKAPWCYLRLLCCSRWDRSCHWRQELVRFCNPYIWCSLCINTCMYISCTICTTRRASGRNVVQLNICQPNSSSDVVVRSTNDIHSIFCDLDSCQYVECYVYSWGMIIRTSITECAWWLVPLDLFQHQSEVTIITETEIYKLLSAQ